MKILITGGAGYLGSILTESLLTDGHQVVVVDNFMYGQSSLNHLCYSTHFNVHKLDVRDEKAMKPLIEAADIIIPLAALVGAPICDKDPIGAETINKVAVLQMFKKLSSQQLVIMPTTNSAYGQGDKNNFCDENSPLKPLSLYAKQKVEVEQELMSRQNSISFRLATVFGMSPRMRIDLLVNDFTYRAVKDGFLVLFESHFKRNYIHVRDVANAFKHGIENFATMRGEIFNVGLSDANLSKLELCEQIKEFLPKLQIIEKEVGQDPDQRNYIVSNAKIEKTGFQPQYSLEQGIEELIKGYQMIQNSKYTNI